MYIDQLPWHYCTDTYYCFNSIMNKFVDDDLIKYNYFTDLLKNCLWSRLHKYCYFEENSFVVALCTFVARRLFETTQNRYASYYLAIHRGNAASILVTLPSGTNIVLSDYNFFILFFLNINVYFIIKEIATEIHYKKILLL